MKRAKLVFLGLLLFGIQISVLGAPGAQAWVEALRDDDESVARNAEESLVKLGPDAVRPLQKVLDDANFKVRRRAAEALGNLGPVAKRAAPDLVERLLDPQFDVQEAARKALLQMGNDAIPALIDAVKSEQAGLRKVALDVLAQTGPRGVPTLLNILKNDDSPYLRATAAESLGTAPPFTPEITQVLIQALADLQDSVRGAAADSLGRGGASSQLAIRPLFTLSRDDKDSLIRRKAEDALFQIAVSTPVAGASVAVEYKQLMKDPDSTVRLKALSAFERMGAAGLPDLIDALSDRENSVSDEAGNAIVRMGPAALPALEPLRQSTFPYLKRKAEELIKRIQQPARRKSHARS